MRPNFNPNGSANHLRLARQDVAGPRQAPQAAGNAQARLGPQAPRTGFRDAPVVSQLHPNGATAANYRNGASNCAPAAAATLARMLGTRSHQTDAELINDLAKGRTTSEGTTHADMKSMIKEVGARQDGRPMIGGYQDSQVKAALAKGNKVVAQLGLPNPTTGKTDPHYVVIAGTDGKGGYRVKDPLRGEYTMGAMQLKQAFLSAPGTGGILMPVAPANARGGRVAGFQSGDGFGAAPRFSANAESNNALFGRGPGASAAEAKAQRKADVTVSLLSNPQTKRLGQEHLLRLLNSTSAEAQQALSAVYERVFGQPGIGQKMKPIALE
ncbi:MAG TPA: C39 family peptidase [Longimicrobium sp.]|nr:C39 family peptidase [Longimicrobium sp.]